MWITKFFLTIFFTFFQLLNISFNWKKFCWLTNIFFFSAKSKDKKTDSWYLVKKYLVIHEMLVVRMPRMSYWLAVEWTLMPGSLYILVTPFFGFLGPLVVWFSLQDKIKNKLLHDIFVTLAPKSTKNQVTKMVWKQH